MTDLAVGESPSPWRRAFVLSLPILAGYLLVSVGSGTAVCMLIQNLWTG